VAREGVARESLLSSYFHLVSFFLLPAAGLVLAAAEMVSVLVLVVATGVEHLLLAMFKVLEPPLVHHLTPLRKGVLCGRRRGAFRLGLESALHFRDLAIPTHHHVVHNGIGIHGATRHNDVVRVDARRSGGHELGGNKHGLFRDVQVGAARAAAVAGITRARVYFRQGLGKGIRVVLTNAGGMVVGNRLLVVDGLVVDRRNGLALQSCILENDI
jgi:hypothetical protein